VKRIFLFLVLVLIAAMAFAQDEGGLGFEKTGIVFGFASVLTPTGFTDAYQAGIGVKAWLDDQNAVRGVFRLAFVPDQGAGSQTDLGLGAAWERHLGSGPVTPYMGAFAGTSIDIQNGSDVDLYLGGVFGGEMPVMDNLNIFGEYDLRFLIDDIGFWIDNVANFGFILYFD
jgi:hypothetical protein